MSNIMLVLGTWLAFVAHIVIGIVVVRRIGSVQLLPLLNLVVAICVLGYWLQRWYGTVARGVTWYLSDQIVPAYALIVGFLALMTLTGRRSGAWAQWLIFAFDTLVLLAAALFFSFFRINRLI